MQRCAVPRVVRHARRFLVLFALLLASCGGGGGESTPPSDTGGGPDAVAPDGGGPADVAAPEDSGGPVGGPDVLQPDTAPPADVPAPRDTTAEVSLCPLDQPCNDHDPCTSDDRCTAAGACAGTAYTCDDGLACTDDLCDGEGGCEVELGVGACVIGGVCYEQGDAQEGHPCLACRPDVDPHGWTDNEGRACEDGDLCTVGDRCESGVCLPGLGTLPCNDNDICNGVESCDSEQGCVAGEPLECDDANVCNGLETCDPMAGCQFGTRLLCSDDDVCTGVETCDPTDGCHDGTPLACDDGNACNGVEVCDAVSGCRPGAPPACNDGLACNGVETCAPATGCVAGAPLDCDDDNDCTVDSCSEQAGCQHGDRPGTCDDGNPCTAPGVCSNGVCAGTAPLCAPGEFCSVGCDGTEQVWCFGADPYPLDCADYDATCGLLGDEPACTCAADYAPRCAGGGTLVVCRDDGVLGQFDCALAGGGCGVDETGVAACRCDPGAHTPTCVDSFNLSVCNEDGELVVQPCGDLGGVCDSAPGEPGRCACGPDFSPSCWDSALQIFCSDGADGDLLLLDCTVLGTTCGAAGGAPGCVCGDGFEAACDADGTLYACGADGVVTMRDCVAEGGTCGAGANGLATCLGPGCPGIPTSNVCDGDVLHECRDGWDVPTDCAAIGAVCGVEAGGQFGCRQGAAPCQDVTEAGECSGDQVLWCQDGVLQQFDCGSYGAHCGLWDAAGFTWCSCSDDTFVPGCYGETLVTQCRQDGWLELGDCGALGGTCGVVEGGASACVGSGCDGESFLGRCDADSIVWCENELVRRFDCAEANGVCAWDVGGTFYNCLAAPPDCGSVPAEGRCVRNVLEYCDAGGPVAGGTVVGVDCAESGRTCEWSDAGGGYTCVGCAGIPAEGVCGGDRLYWCGQDIIQAFDCGAWGAGCGPDGMGGESCLCAPGEYAASCASQTLVSCHPYGVLQTTDCAALGASCGALDGGPDVCYGPGCAGETFEGRCEDGVLTYCDQQLVTAVDCAAFGYGCGFEAERGIYNCLPPQGDCGVETAEGRCEGDVFVACDATGGHVEVVRQDCAALLQVCGETAPGVYGCVASASCGGETYEGRCEGATLVYCAEGQVHHVDCGVGGLACGDAGGVMDCVPSPASGCGAVSFFGSCAGDVLSYCEGDTVRTIDCAAGDLVCADDGILGMNCVRPDVAGVCAPACGAGFLCVEGLCRANGSQTRDWTVLVYVAGDNNLSPAAILDIEEMERVGTGARVAVVVQAEFSTPTDPPAALQGDTFRFSVPYAPAPGIEVATIAASAIGNRNMGSAATLAEFLRWGIDRYPAKRYALVLWNHGAGYAGGFQDETSGDGLSLREIRDGIRAAGVFLDVVDFDACLMGMYEIVAELYDVVGFVAASEEVEPGCGDPYHTILGALAANPAMGGRALATAFVDEYIAWYAGDDVLPGCALDVTKAALDLSQAIPFHERVSALANALRNEVRARRATIFDLITATQAFEYPFYRDIADFASRVAASDLSLEARQAAGRVVDAVTSGAGIVIRNGVLEQTGFKDLSGANGISIFAPDLVDAQSYPGLLEGYVESLTFRQRQSAWSELVESLHAQSAGNLVSVHGSVRLAWFANQARSVPSDANVDLWLIGPENGLYGPLLGTVTPHGYFSPESSTAGVSQESFTWADRVASGSFLFFVVYDGNGPTHRIAWPEVTIQLEGVPGFPRTLRRVDGHGAELPLSMDAPLASPLGRLLAGDLTPAEVEGMWSNAYTNVWMMPAVEIE